MELILKTDDPNRLNEAQEAFARAYVELHNVAAAYRLAYPTNASTGITNSAGNAMLRVPKIAARIDELRALAVAQTTIRTAELIRDLYEISNADVNELIRAVVQPCRRCHGVDFKKQWIDAAEFARAMDDYLRSLKTKRPLALPDMQGGFGYDARGDTNPACPVCLGDGMPRVVMGDTTKLSPSARKLYKGVKQKADGSIEVLMHDQMQARDMIARMLGAYKADGKGMNDAPNVPEMSLEGLTQESAQRAYLELTQS